MSLTDTPTAEGTIEPDNDVTRAADGSGPRSQFQSWYHMSPGNYSGLPPQSAYRSPYASSSPYVSPYAKQDAAAKPEPSPAAVPPGQSPPPLGIVPIEPQSASGTGSRQPSHLLQTTIPLDSTPVLSGQSPQTDTASGLQSPELTTPPEDGIAAMPPVSDPQGRQRCEVWPMTYRLADGWIKTFWCVQVDGESYYQYKLPDREELARRYNLVYFPDMQNAT